MKRFTAAVLTLVVLVATKACIYPFEVDYSGTEMPLVIEGSILIGDETTVKVSRVSNGLGETKAVGPDFTFTAAVEGEDGTRVTASGGTMCYLDTRSFSASQRYRLLVHMKETGEDYASEWLSVVKKPVLDDACYRIDEDKGAIDFSFSMHGNGASPYYSVAYDEVYEYRSLATTNLRWDYGKITDVGVPYQNRTCWMTKASNVMEVVSTGTMKDDRLVDYPVRSISRYDRAISVRYQLRIKASLISEEAFKYWNNLDKISYDGGDLFRPIPSDVRGNLHNVNKPDEWVIGYISASESLVAELRYDNAREKFYRTSETEKAIVLASQVSDAGQNQNMLFYNGYYPYRAIYGANESAPEYYMWIKETCLDCRSLGGDNVKPEGWDDLFEE